MATRDRFNTALQAGRCFMVVSQVELDLLLRTGKRLDGGALAPAVITELKILNTHCSVEIKNVFSKNRANCLVLVLNNSPQAATELKEAMYLNGTGLTAQGMLNRLRNRQPPIAGVFDKSAAGAYRYNAEP